MPVAGLALFASGSTHALTLSFWRDGSWVLRHLRDARRLAVRHCELADPPIEQPPEILKLRLDPPVAAQRHVRLGRQLVERLQVELSRITTDSDASETRVGCWSRSAARSASTRMGAWHSTNSMCCGAERVGEGLAVGTVAEVVDHQRPPGLAVARAGVLAELGIGHPVDVGAVDAGPCALLGPDPGEALARYIGAQVGKARDLGERLGEMRLAGCRHAADDYHQLVAGNAIC